jgi:4-hydroxy-tetrahydrodipicolinate synthase
MKTTFPNDGILAALWTPLDARGRVLKSALAIHLAFLRARGVRGVLTLGSTGEFPRLTLDQRKAMIEAAAGLAAPMPVIANISSPRLGEVAALGRFARGLDVAGVALMPPYFYPISQADLLEFFLRAADAVDLPFCLYNFPEYTSNRIGLEVVAAFADRARMAAIKQSGDEFGYHVPLVRLGREKGFAVFTGADTRMREAFALGAAGCIGGLANFVPEPMVNVFNACLGPDPRPCARDAARLREIGRAVSGLAFPLNMAAGMEARGLEPGEPKTAVSADTAKRHRKIVAELRRKFRAWGLSPAP